MEKNKGWQDSFEDQEDLIEEETQDIETQEDEQTPEDENPLEAITQERDKLKDDFLRALADMENLKKRCAQEIEKNNKYAISNFAKALLPVADNLQRAIDAVKDTKDEGIGKFVQGVELTQQELTKVFAKFGIKKMDIMGKVFDPHFHQVVQEVPDDKKEPGTVIAELQTGYMIEDRILREAMVVVSKKA